MPLRFVESLKKFRLFSSIDDQRPVEEPSFDDESEAQAPVDQPTYVPPVGAPIGDEVNPARLNKGDKVRARGERAGKDYDKVFVVEARNEDDSLALKGGYTFRGGYILGYKDRRCAQNVWLERA